MRIRTIPQVYRNVNRWREILSILSKYGLAGWLSRIDFAFAKGLLKNRNGQVLADESRETRIRLALEELGPTFIKLGQIMSTRPDMVGVDLAEELEKLQTKVPADPPKAVADLIAEELGRPLEDLFAEFSEAPVASASIGQVHRARLITGELVAVKVQRQDIARHVRVDLDILQGLAQLAEPNEGFEHYLSGGRFEFSAQNFHQGGFAAAVCADQAVAIAVVEFDRNVFKKGFGPELYSEVCGRDHEKVRAAKMRRVFYAKTAPESFCDDAQSR